MPCRSEFAGVDACFFTLGVSAVGKSEAEYSRLTFDLTLPFRAAFMFRPGFIQPAKGVQSSFRLYRAAYVVTTPFFPLIRRLFPRFVTTSEKVGQAMIHVSDTGYPKSILESDDINRASG